MMSYLFAWVEAHAEDIMFWLGMLLWFIFAYVVFIKPLGEE
jgi:type II secretory pathway component PulM